VNTLVQSILGLGSLRGNFNHGGRCDRQCIPLFSDDVFYPVIIMSVHFCATTSSQATQMGLEGHRDVYKRLVERLPLEVGPIPTQSTPKVKGEKEKKVHELIFSPLRLMAANHSSFCT